MIEEVLEDIEALLEETLLRKAFFLLTLLWLLTLCLLMSITILGGKEAIWAREVINTEEKNLYTYYLC